MSGLLPSGSRQRRFNEIVLFQAGILQAAHYFDTKKMDDPVNMGGGISGVRVIGGPKKLRRLRRDPRTKFESAGQSERLVETPEGSGGGDSERKKKRGAAVAFAAK